MAAGCTVVGLPPTKNEANAGFLFRCSPNPTSCSPWGLLTKRTESYAKGQKCQVELIESGNALSGNANSDPILTLSGPDPDVHLGHTSI